MKRRYSRFANFIVLVALVFVCQGPYPVRCIYDGDPDIRGVQYNRVIDKSGGDDSFSQHLRHSLRRTSLTVVKKKVGEGKKSKVDQPPVNDVAGGHDRINKKKGSGSRKGNKPAAGPIPTRVPAVTKGAKPSVPKTTKPKTPKPTTPKPTTPQPKTSKPKAPVEKPKDKKNKVNVEVSIKKVQLVVIYESLCPYSRRLVYSQLRPTYTKLAPYINLTLLPFGKARVRKTQDGQGHTITRISCQHGENECVGNKIETCVLRVVKETVTAVQIIACMSENYSPHRAGEQCASAYGVEWSLVDSCVKTYGEEYELEVAETTWKYKKQVTRVPLVVMDGDQSNYVNYHAQNDMIVIVCREIRRLGNKEPKGCRQERHRRRRRRKR
ncbi:unnamed protein product [Ixodes hexagonus]